MRKIIVLSYLLFFVVKLVVAQEVGFPIIRNYTPKEYNNAPQVFSIVQDQRGVLYFGVGDGVMEYDGVTWRAMPTKKKVQIEV